MSTILIGILSTVCEWLLNGLLAYFKSEIEKHEAAARKDQADQDALKRLQDAQDDHAALGAARDVLRGM